MIANRVCEINRFSAAPGNEASDGPPSCGGVGNSLAGSVCIFDSNRSAATVTLLPPLSSSMRISVSGSALTISNSFFAGSVSVPGFDTVASQRLRSATSRSVASSDTAALLGVNQHIGKNRNGVLALDNSLQEGQFFEQIVLANDKLHGQGGLLSTLALLEGLIDSLRKIKETKEL